MLVRGALTRDKLNEARFFLAHLKGNVRKEKEFHYFLSAFISSARSVSWTMKKEFKHVTGWEDWHETKEKVRTKDIDSLYKGTNAMRIKAKLGSLTTSAAYMIRLKMVVIHKAVLRSGLKGERVSVRVSGTKDKHLVELVSLTGKRVPLPNTKAIWLERRVEEFPAKDVLEVCQEYYNHLVGLVEECTKMFGDSIAQRADSGAL